MKALLKRLAALNLVWIMLLSMLTVTAGAASGSYVYHVSYDYGGSDTYYSDYLDLEYKPYYSSLMGWSLEPGGLPVIDEAEVPSNASGDVHLYGVIGTTVVVTTYDGSVSYYSAGPALIGGTQADEDGSAGTGWEYVKGKLHLYEDYPGDPIVAAGDIIVYAHGNITVNGSGGPAIRSLTGSVHIKSMGNDESLTLTGDNAPAIVSQKLVYLENPSNVELSATAGYPVSTYKIVYETSAVATNKLLVNSSYMGDDKANAVEMDTVNIYDPLPLSGSTLRPYQSYIRFEGVQQSELELKFTFDPGEGNLPGLAAGVVDTVTVDGSGLDLSNYYSAEVTLPEQDEPQRGGYIFAGWQQEGNSDNSYVPGETLSVEQRSSSLSALWTEAPGSEYVVFHGNGEYLSSPGMESALVDALPLEGGMITIPDNNAYGFVGWAAEKTELPDMSRVDFYEGLYFPGQTVSLPSGTTLYAVYYNRDTAVIHGNGQLTANGSDRILVMAGQLQLTPGSLYVYSKAADAQEKGFFVAEGKALLDYNTKADGSGDYNGVAGSDVYAQWVDAPAGSVLLYSYTPANADGRYGKLLTPAEAANFDPNSDYGFEWFAHDFAGWYHGDEKVTGTLPEADESGYIVLRGKWDPCTVTYADHVFYSSADLDGDVYISKGDEKGGKTFNGWNTEADGSGDWYLPGKYYPLPESITVYPQYLDTPADGSWVLAASTDGRGLYRSLETAPGSGSKVIVTMPESENGWIYSTQASIGIYFYDSFGYYGGKTYEISPRIKLSEYDGREAMFHGSGGTFDNGSEFRSVILGGTSWTTLYLYPQRSDFETVPENESLSGWTPEDSSAIYKPGTAFSGSGNYYAVWDSADTVYVNFKDIRGGNDYSTSVKTKAGAVINVPTASRIGYKLDGWSDGVTTWVPGAEYTVPEGGATLTAVWSVHEVLVVDGVEYDPETNYDFGSPEDGGWKYEYSDGWGYLHLYNYSGKEIYSPKPFYLYLYGENTITGSEGKAAVGGKSDVYFHEDNAAVDTPSVTVKGGSGAPAVQANYVSLTGDITAEMIGGSGAPAVHVGYRVYITNGNITLIGGSDAPAFTVDDNDYGFALDVYETRASIFAGDSPETAVEITGDDYNGEHCIITRPRLYTLTINAGGGKVNGRSQLKLRAEYGQKAADISELKIYDRNGSKLIGWYDAEGRQQNYSVWLYNDVELTARWNENHYDRYIYLDTRYEGSVNGIEGGAFIELPESGTVRLPQPEFSESYSDRVFEYWYVPGEGSNLALPANCDIPVEWLQSGLELRPSYYNSNYGRNDSYVFIHPNGTAFGDEPGFHRRWLNGGSQKFEAWWCRDNVHGFVIDSLNTEADGSGIRYDVGDMITVPAGETLVLYAQWKPNVPTYVTTKANDRVPGRWDDPRYNKYGYINGIESWEYYLSSLMGWRTADGSRIFFCGENCDLPAGTTLYAFYGDFWQEAAIRLYGNGADYSAPLQFSKTWRQDEKTTRVYTTTEVANFIREGYELIGWNTKADGSGTFYEKDVRFHVGYSDSDGNNWQIDENLAANLPKELYAQWRKLPDAIIPIPKDMQEYDNGVIYAALYDENCRMIELIDVEPGDDDYVGIYTEFETYAFFCLADDGSMLPLTTHEPG